MPKSAAGLATRKNPAESLPVVRPQNGTHLRPLPANGNLLGVAPPTVDRTLSAPGRPLEDSTRTFFESRFGFDFSRVRVHTDSAAGQSANDVAAHAYTVGHHIAFEPGRYAPESSSGRRLLAHEMAHVVQQQPGGPAPAFSPDAPSESSARRAADAAVDGGRSVVVEGRTGLGVARQPKEPATRLTPEQMLAEVLKQRGWTNRVDQPMPAEGPNAAAEASKMKGPALGSGRDTHSLIQVTDKAGNVVAHESGAHLAVGDDIEAAARRDVPARPGEVGKVHAERMAVGALDRRLRGVDVGGGTMVVVVDQLPCAAGSGSCMNALESFAKEKGLKLEVYVPTRESQQVPGRSVTPKTASQTAFKGPERANAGPTGSAQLKQVYPAGGSTEPGSSRGSGGGGAPGATMAPSVGNMGVRPTTTPRLSLEALKLIGKLESEGRASARFTARVQGYVGALNGLMQALAYLDALSDAMKMGTEGTLLGDAQRTANVVYDRGTEALDEANARWESVSFLELAEAVESAFARRDQETLNDLANAGVDYSHALDDAVDRLQGAADDLEGREKVLRTMSDLYLTAAKIPQGPQTASNAHQWAMSESLGKLGGTVGSAATKFREAYVITKSVRDGVDKAASIANSYYWSITLEKIAAVQARIDREQAKQKTPLTPLDSSHKSSEVHPPSSLGSFPSTRMQVPAKCPGGCHQPTQQRDAPRFPNKFGGPGNLSPNDEKILRDWLRETKK